MLPVSATSGPGDFRLLAVQIREAGFLKRRPGYYGVKIVMTLTAFAAGWAALVVIGNSWTVLAAAAFLGVMFTQLGFVNHDAGHQQVFLSRRRNRVLGLAVGNALIGLSFGWWVSKHNAHHAHPNQVDRDPDIARGAAVFTSTDGATHARNQPRPWLAFWQVWLFFPAMLLRSLGLHLSGIGWLLRNRDRGAALEALLILLHAALYLTVVAWVLSPLKAVAFIVVQQAVFSVYLGCSFAPNHKGMPILERDTQMGFAQRQVITARNITGGRFTDLMLGGLNHQIEHHLFPTMPRPNLMRAQSLIRGFCINSGLGYSEDSLIGSYRQAIHHPQVASA
jgi:fatty acid desaturase